MTSSAMSRFSNHRIYVKQAAELRTCKGESGATNFAGDVSHEIRAPIRRTPLDSVINDLPHERVVA